MNEVEKLREETRSIICNCSNPCCPFLTEVTSIEVEHLADEDQDFEEEISPDFGFGSMETIYPNKCNRNRFSLPNVAQLQFYQQHHCQLHQDHFSNSTSLTNIPRGVQKRADGTILENDYPGFYCSSRKSKKKKRWMGSFSVAHLNRLEVCSVEVPPLADCQVDQDRVSATNEDYVFSRRAPERKNMRSPHGINKRYKLQHTDSNLTAYRRASADPLSIDQSLKELMRHSSVPSIVEVTKTMTC